MVLEPEKKEPDIPEIAPIAKTTGANAWKCPKPVIKSVNAKETIAPDIPAIPKFLSLNLLPRSTHNAALCGKFGAQRKICPTAAPC